LYEAFRDFNVPLKVRRTLSFADTPLGQLVLRLPLLVEEGFPVEGVARFLASRYLTSIWEPDLDAGRYFHLAGIRDDRVGAMGESGAYQLRLAQLASQLSLSKDASRAAEVRKAALQVERFKSALSLCERGTLEQHLNGFEQTVARLGLKQASHSRGESVLGQLVDEALQEEQAALVALKALAPMMRETARGVEALSVQLSRREFSRWLIDAASELSFAIPAPRVGAVTALDFEEASGRKFTHVFMVGLNEGEESGYEPPRGVLTVEEQAELNTAARATLFRMSSGETAARLPLLTAKQRLDFFLGLCASSQSVTFSFARRELLGRTLSISPLLQEVLRLNPSIVVERISLGSASESHSLTSERAWKLKVADTDVAREAAWGADCAQVTQMETERLKFFSSPNTAPGEFSGRVDAGLLQPALAFQAERPLTPARLGVYGNCVFQGFLSDVLGVRQDEQQGEDLSSSSKGSLVHQVLEELLPVLQGPLPANLEDTVIAAVEEVALQHEKSAAVGHPLLWELQKKRITREVVSMLESERVFPFDGVKPEKAEWKFAEELSGIGVVAGKVDRVDVGGRQAVVVDYKTARINGNAERVRRLFVQEWQIPIYAWAVQKAGLGAHVDGAWVSTRDGVKKLSAIVDEVGVSLDELISFDPLVQERLAKEAKPNLGTALTTLISRLRTGDVSPRPNDCEYCPYRAVCRISSRKLHDEGW
jgi:ATP-dependent helicase/DNAse subunit B